MNYSKIKAGVVKFWVCWFFGNHDWTCDASEGIAPTYEQTHNGMRGFLDYAKMYCKRCGVESELSKRDRRLYDEHHPKNGR
jgi:hypothetical protein